MIFSGKYWVFAQGCERKFGGNPPGVYAVKEGKGRAEVTTNFSNLQDFSHFYTKKETTSRSPLSFSPLQGAGGLSHSPPFRGPGGLPLMSLVVLISTDFPEVSLHGLFATGLILLCREVLLVRSDLVQIALTSLHSSCYSGEACACIQLVGRQRGGTFVTVCFEGVDALTVGVRGCRSAVGGNEIVTVVVTIRRRWFRYPPDLLS